MGGTTQDVHPVLVCNAIVGDTYTLYDSGTMVATQENVGWTLPTLANGAHNLSLTYTTGTGVSAPVTIGFNVNATPFAPVITNLVDATGPHMGNVAPGGIATDSHPTINGTGHAGDTINVYDNTTLLGSTLVGADGTWHYQPAAALPNGAHNVHATSTNAAGTSDVSNAYAFSTTQIMVTGVYSDGALVSQGGTATGTLTLTGWIADPSLASKGMALYISGGNQGTTVLWDNSVQGTMTVNGNIFTATVAQNPNFPVNLPLESSTYHIDARAVGASGQVTTVSNPAMGWTFTDNFNAKLATVSATHVDASPAIDDAAVLAANASVSPVASQAGHHAAVGEHDTFKGTTGNATVDLNADPAAYFKDATAHIEGGAGGVHTPHLTGDHQALDLTSLTGKTAAAKVSGIEAIDLGGSHNMLKLSLVDVLNLTEPDLFQKDGKQQMLVNGSNGDSVDLSSAHIAGVTDGHWMQEGTAIVGGVTYNVYEHSGAHAELLVQQGVQIAVHG
ncbi:hypothetical protein EOS_29410 [Caballeronia mineralivorans PML1(12)]|uniref:Bacterial Ig-like domain-containing protein n=1 Tax=Caballeronia mineralivorans PML1(12) TaxID=908627 RepID=A0A0J1CPX5_9BURK|nr:Ig-like domain-containing protein [Caballeronia mineralivorans]KLU22674.1 hypothetical protein EOS_29410 [Caballeronia mineralivorans PML1(12)]